MEAKCPEQPLYQLTAEQVAAALAVDVSQGLSEEEVLRRRERFGPNQLQQKGRKTILQMFGEQFKSFMILVLLAAALVSGLLGEWADTAIIAAIVVLNAVMGVVQENKAENSLAALNRMSAPHCKLLRQGQVQVHESWEIVPGDVVVLETGDAVPADLRLVESVNLQIQEAALTGESLPEEKDAAWLTQEEQPLGDRLNLAFASSLVTYGRGRGVAYRTGMETEVGQIATLIQQGGQTETPLKRRLEHLGKVLGLATLVICLILFGVGLLYGRPPLEIFFIAVSLAVAAIPEGLPAIATIVLALGVQRMVKRNAIIRTLPAVETLGSATVICSDKTGTLTQNKMTVRQFWTGDQQGEAAQASREQEGQRLLLNAALLCNDARRDEEGHQVGDPTETALLVWGEETGLRQQQAEQEAPRVMELPFDSVRKRMTTAHQEEEGYRVYCKGGVDEVLSVCGQIWRDGKPQPLDDAARQAVAAANQELAAAALRVLALATGPVKSLPATGEELEQDLVFLGLAGMIDPARPEAAVAVQTCRRAGIKPVMITGDHKLTAVAIARDLGILQEEREAISGAELERLSDEQLAAQVRDFAVYARVSPAHKVRIVEAWQQRGQVVAMTGDGVNDAPALKRADIGAAMGITGTEVAKEAADMVLTDDNFATIVSAVEEGRRIFDNILKSVQFLLSCNLGEILTLFVATLLNWAAPLLPIHLLWVNLVTDSLPALALGVDPAEPNIMDRQARVSRSLFTPGMLWRVAYQGVMVGGLTLIAFLIGRQDSLIMGQTMAFAVLAFSQLFHALNLRSHRRSVFRTGLKGNRYLGYALLAAVALMLLVMEVPGINTLFKLESPNLGHWLVILGLSVLPVVIVELFKLLRINQWRDEK